METLNLGKFDVVVIGAGHSGCEAALATARMGKKTLVLSINLEAVANMFCNPAIGGTGKGHLVREIDALGGEMGINIDKTFIQSKMLNTSKGPAVHSLRAQADKQRYHEEMKRTLEKQKNLWLKQAEAIDIDIEGGKVKGVLLQTGAYYEADAVIIATGTFLAGKIYVGQSITESGPNGLAPSKELAVNLKKRGVRLRRFKTGTPCRALGSSIDFSKMIPQYGDINIVPFSFMNDKLEKEQQPCWLTYTNLEGHEILRSNFDRSPMFTGVIEGIGPRYCPSIEDKVRRFADKERHQCFVEPEGLSTDEMYIQGMSTSLPVDVQEEFYHSIPGFENIELVRNAYAIEYDSIDPLDLKLNLEHREISGLFCAGQFNGSSGYEEAAAQGLMAGINAALKLDGKDPFILDRSEAYIGVLLDDLITKGTNEPYRIMTSRAEYRLVLRQDNADIRLTEKGHEIGLVSSERYEKFKKTIELKDREIERLKSVSYGPSVINPFIEKLGMDPVDNRYSLAELLKRPEITYENLAEIDPDRPELPFHVIEKIEVEIKYEGYIKKQYEQIERFKKLENKKLPEGIDYMSIEGLCIEARQKLSQFKPVSVGQASRISGVSPADINVLLVYLTKQKGSPCLQGELAAKLPEGIT